MKKWISIIVAGLMVAVFVYQKIAGPIVPHAIVEIGSERLIVEVARTPAARAQGLSGRDRLPRDGMLFIMDSPGRHGFWMKDMKFPIDIIWLRTGRIVDIAQFVQPPASSGESPEVYYPRSNVDAVLELGAGFSADHHLQISEPVKYTQ